MDTVIKVKGMHCNACQELIKMEAEDLGLLDKIRQIDIDEQAEQGEISLTNVSDEEKKKLEQAIEAMEQYSIIRE